MLLVKDLMSETLETVNPDTSIREALVKMNRAGFRHLPVLDDGRLVGVITERDIRLAVNSPIIGQGAELGRSAVLNEIAAAECMTPEPKSVTSTTLASSAAESLRLHGFGAMPVVDDDNLVGIISYVDFLRHYASQP